MPEAMNSYALLLLKSEDAEDKSQAIKYFKLAIDKNDHNAMCNYANILYNGELGIEVDKKNAIKYYKMSSKLGNTIAMNKYGIILRDSNGHQMNKKKALNYFKQASENGHEEATNNYNLLRKEMQSENQNESSMNKNGNENEVHENQQSLDSQITSLYFTLKQKIIANPYSNVPFNDITSSLNYMNDIIIESYLNDCIDNYTCVNSKLENACSTKKLLTEKTTSFPRILPQISGNKSLHTNSIEYDDDDDDALSKLKADVFM